MFRGYDGQGGQRQMQGKRIFLCGVALKDGAAARKTWRQSRRQKTETGGVCMGYVENELQEQALERMNEMLSDALSLVILLENDMEIQKSDGVHARILRMVHENMKGAQKELSAYMRQEEE